jgi:uncharacterized protein with HEPN domain
MSIDQRAAKRLHDALTAGLELLSYCHGRTQQEFEADRTLQLVVERLIEIIGEALHQAEVIEPAIGDRVHRLRDIVGTRNRLIHGYADVNYSLIWDMVVDHVPDLVETLDGLLNEQTVLPE